jgi:hypothetical protein
VFQQNIYHRPFEKKKKSKFGTITKKRTNKNVSMSHRDDDAAEDATFDDSVLWLPDGSKAAFVRVDKRFSCPVKGCVRSTSAAGGTATVLASKVGLLEHLREKHGWSHYERYRCDFAGCSCAFAFKAKLVSHQLTHDKAKREEAAARKKAKADEARAAPGVEKHAKTVKRRMVVSGVVNGVEMFFCPVDDCDASFTSYYLVNQHRKLRHAEGEMRDPTRPLSPKEHTHKRQRREGVPTCKCVYCDKACTTAADLTDHYTSCQPALCAFDAALPSHDIGECLRVVRRLPGRLSAAWDDLFGAAAADESESETDDDASDVSSDSSDSSDEEEDDASALTTPVGLTQSIACSIVLHRISVSGAPLQLRCPVQGCGKVVSTCNALSCHARAAHVPKRGPAYACDQCAYTHMSQGQLRRHVRDVHGTERPFVCSASETCGATFKTRGDERKHVSTVHADSSSAVTCCICDKTFRSMRALANHMFVHAARKNVCGICGDAFPFPSKLAKHTRVHPGDDGMFQCAFDGCGQNFVLHDQRAWHEIVAHGAPSAQCDTCKALFFTRAKMLRHVAKVHNPDDPGFTPGASDGERAIYRALLSTGVTFRTEVPLLNRLRLDFALCWPDGTMCCAIEYDGVLHFKASSDADDNAWALLSQIQRDNVKSRRLRAAGVPLLRLKGELKPQYILNATADALRMLLPDSHDTMPLFGDFVCPEAYTSLLADQVRAALASGGASGSVDICSAARQILERSPFVRGLAASCTPAKAEANAEGVLILYLRHNSAAADDATVEALAALARNVPEFHVAVAPFQRTPLSDMQTSGVRALVARLTPRGAISPAATVPALPRLPSARPGKFHCWFEGCPAHFNTTGTERIFNNTFLRHLKAAHGDVVRVRCSFSGCTATASSREELQQHLTVSHPGHAKEDSRRVFCAAPSCATLAFFSEWCLFFRHANQHHGTRFPDFMTLRCSHCRVIFSAAKHLDAHHCAGAPK